MRALILMFLLVPSAWAVGPSRIGILAGGELNENNAEASIRRNLPRIMVEELRRSGLDARLLVQTLEDVKPGEDYDILVDVRFADADTEVSGGIGAGIPVGSVHVGAEVGMSHSRAAVEVVLYDGRTLEHLRTLEFQAASSSPTLTGLGVGGRNGFLFLRLPFRGSPERRVTRQLARSAAAQIAAQ